MIYLIGEFLDRETQRYDVCIIGSGPSGICVGLELLYSGLTVCTLEGGELEANHFFDQLKDVESPGLEIGKDSRVRAFGGTSNTWSGIIAPLDPIDLAPRRAIARGWPPEAEVATSINTRGHRYNLPHLSLFNATTLHLGAWRNSEHLSEKVFLVQAPAMNFGRKYRYAYLRNDFDLVLGAVATSLNSQENGGCRVINSVVFRSASGRFGKLTSTIYILATGCIENIRILFNSKDEAGVALGNIYDQLGRGFMNHPKGYVGEIWFKHPLSVTDPVFKLQQRYFGGFVGFRLKDSLQEVEGLLNPCLRLEPLHGLADPTISKGVTFLLNLRAALRNALRLYFRAAVSSGVAVLTDARGMIQALKLPLRIRKARRATTVKRARVRCFVDMDACPENRITLSELSDPLGVKIPIVKYDVSERSLKSVATLLDRFSSEVRALGIGEFVPYASPLRELISSPASHHLGGTPMGLDAQTSAVDPELRLHGVDNLYLTGGSTFPTGGNANPTLTMIGLSIRLADTIRASLPKPDYSETTLPSSRGQGIIILGAGRRVAEDVVDRKSVV